MKLAGQLAVLAGKAIVAQRDAHPVQKQPRRFDRARSSRQPEQE
jgi:hypothetical protein